MSAFVKILRKTWNFSVQHLINVRKTVKKLGLYFIHGWASRNNQTSHKAVASHYIALLCVPLDWLAIKLFELGHKFDPCLNVSHKIWDRLLHSHLSLYILQLTISVSLCCSKKFSDLFSHRPVHIFENDKFCKLRSTQASLVLQYRVNIY